MDRFRTDLGLDLECRDCGAVFRETLLRLPRNQALKCPVCRSASLSILGHGSLLVEAGEPGEAFERSSRGPFVEMKIKL